MLGMWAIAQPAWSLPPVSQAAIDLKEPLPPAVAFPLSDGILPTPDDSAIVQFAATPAPPDPDPNLPASSPLLERWLKEIPNVLEEIRRDPSFYTRLRLGYSYFPSSRGANGLNVGVEDVFIGRTGLTLSADYHTTFDDRRESWGADLRYYMLPLGNYINIAPVIGYRSLQTNRYDTDGLNVGLRLLLLPTRSGAADISLTQSWVAPRTDEEVGLTTLSFGYALTRNLRLSTDIQKQNSPKRKDSRVGISLEWMFR